MKAGLLIWWVNWRRKRVAVACARYALVAYDARAIRAALAASMMLHQLKDKRAIPSQYREFIVKGTNDLMLILGQPLTPLDEMTDSTGKGPVDQTDAMVATVDEIAKRARERAEASRGPA